ncbi:hypothetical protein HELRODRAFT_185207 [Helobdella robusta]|uniref:Adenosine kinase n=1 Tax=Helobdella robusta TaxID=6412 RepID=T1FMI4_HELRO|nr:hypothetical protein HELRODRAFT_185207 [Helobdella robusta]ESN90364.1 hypothetical protein HELRODRAFT_185207 [Helobdella robusta]
MNRSNNNNNNSRLLNSNEMAVQDNINNNYDDLDSKANVVDILSFNCRKNCSIGGEDHVMGGHVEGVLFAIGNPLLDLIGEVKPEFLQKHKLNPEDCIVLTSHPTDIVNDFLSNHKVLHVPGGATQNSIRIAQWLIGVPHATSFMGCIKRDEIGQILEKKVRDEQVNCCYVYDDSEPTGKCVICLTGSQRTYVAYLGAARHLKSSHLDDPLIWSHVAKARYYYFSGFPLINCPDVLLRVSRFAVENDRLVAFNLSTVSICRDYLPQVLQLLPYIDVLFGNQEEAYAFAQAKGLQLTEIRDIALYMARYRKENGKRGRHIILTNGDQPTLVVQEGVITEFPVIRMDPKDVVDLNGAGDAFVGGFLAQLVQGGSIQDCIRSANYAANFIIQQSGCQLPFKPDFSHGAISF